MNSSFRPIWIYDRERGATKLEGLNASELTSIYEKRNDEPTSCGPDKDWRVQSLAFVVDEKLIVGNLERDICYWRVEDGCQVGKPMDAGDTVFDMAVSEKLIVSGMENGKVSVWETESREKIIEFEAHPGSWTSTVDVSPDVTKIATGSDDADACVWSLSTGQQLHCFCWHKWIRRVQFAPNGFLLACASSSSYGSERDSLRIYDIRDGQLVVEFRMIAESLAWVNDSTKLFAISSIGNIHYFDVSSRKTHSIWPTNDDDGMFHRICLAPNGTFVAATSGSSVSFWDTATHQEIGSRIRHPGDIYSLVISTSYNLVIGGKGNVSFWNLCDILSPPYIDDELMTRKIQSETVEACPKEKFQSFLAQAEEFANSENDGQKDDDQVVQDPEQIIKQLRTERAESQQMIDSLTKVLRAHHQMHRCESLFSDGQVVDAAKSLLEITSSTSDAIVKTDTIITDWLSVFSPKCITALEQVGDEALLMEKHDEALDAYVTALSLCPSSPNVLSTKWASTMLRYRSTEEAFRCANQFKLSIFPTFRAICDVLLGDGRVTEAVACFKQMQSGLAPNKSVHNERAEWELDFKQRCAKKSEELADAAMSSQNYDEADELLSAALSLSPPDHVGALVKRSKARAGMKAWDDALRDADEVIKLDPSAHLGYEQKWVALREVERYAEGVAAFDKMLSKLEESPDERVRELRSQYTDARPEIRGVVHSTISHIPQVMIDTVDGRLLDKVQQAEAFEAETIFNELVLSMTTQVDIARIRREVKKFYRYVMFSHRWQGKEPLYKEVRFSAVYNLRESTGSIKLRTFCSLVRSLKFRWAWSDTCCIDQDNAVVIQESLVAMFSWYRGSSLTIIYLLGVSSLSKIPRSLQNSIWNTRAWTYQEYVAAETVQFYTEDWKPYLGLSLWNHKESPVVSSEMGQVSRFSADQLALLRPGLDRIREKLYVASKRKTTRVEDIAYSLMGIFNVSIPVIYGERTRAVGRFLEHILSGSGDVTVLAWTGIANSYNSCLPLDLTVYDLIVPPHIPHMETEELDKIVAELHSSISDLSLARTLYDMLNKLPLATLVSSRLHLPCIVFHLTEVIHTCKVDEETGIRTYHAKTAALGDIEIKTTSELAIGCEHCFVHPWIRPLLDQEYARGTAGLDKTTRALRLVARLKQPFGALLLEKVSRVDYRRVAADSLIMVRVRDEVSLSDLIDNVDTIDVQ